jgi:hypothetical protein
VRIDMDEDLVIDEVIDGNGPQFKRADKSILALFVIENSLAVEDRPPIPSFDLDVPLRDQNVGGLMREKHPREKIHPNQEGIFPYVKIFTIGTILEAILWRYGVGKEMDIYMMVPLLGIHQQGKKNDCAYQEFFHRLFLLSIARSDANPIIYKAIIMPYLVF